MDALQLYVSVPIACFRVAQAREYWETYPCPAPSTIYGMLLSIVGEANRFAHKGTEIAMAMISTPQLSVVLRSLWRIKDKNVGFGVGVNVRPDYQEILSDIRLSIWVREGSKEESDEPLVSRLWYALKNPSEIVRFGGLSLGESTFLVDEVRLWRNGDCIIGRILVADDKGGLSLPIWPDHVGSSKTSWGQFSLEYTEDLSREPEEISWIYIGPLLN